MSKIIVIDGGNLMFRAILLKGGLLKRKAEGDLPQDHFIAPIGHTYFSMIISTLKRIGVNKEDIIIIALDARNSWRKSFYKIYKGQRKEARDKQEFVNWEEAFAKIEKINNELEASTNWHFVKFDNVLNLLDILQTKEGKELIGEDYTDEMFDKDYGCIDGKTLISTNNGQKMIKDLTGNERIYSYNFELKSIELSNIKNIQKTKSYHRYNLYFEGEKEILKITKEHPVYTTKGWKRVEKLKIGDVIYHVSDCKLQYKNNLENLGYFIGYLLGDGHINYKGHKIVIETKDYDSIINLKNLCNMLFDYDPRICTRKRDNPNWSATYAIYITKRNVFNMIVANLELRTDKEFKKGFMGGFFDAEGTFTKHRNIIRITNTKPELINYCIKILNTFQIRNKFYKFQDKRGTGRLPSFVVDVNSKKRTDKFFNIFPTYIQRKKPIILQNGYKIRKIKYLESKWRWNNYNLEIYPNNNYFANNLLVHNCEADDVLATACKVFKDKEVILATGDKDLYQLKYFPNVKIWSFNLKKIKGGTGGYAQIKSPLSIISDKVRLGDISDNIIVDKIADTELEQKRRQFIIDLLDLPDWIEQPIREKLENLPKKEIIKEKLPFQNSLAKRFWEIYKTEKIVTYEYCEQLMAKREEKRKKKAKEKYQEKKKEKLKEKMTGKRLEDLTDKEIKKLEELGMLYELYPNSEQRVI